MSALKSKLSKIASGETHNPPLVQHYLKDEQARPIGELLARTVSRSGKPAKHPPSRYLPTLD